MKNSHKSEVKSILVVLLIILSAIPAYSTTVTCGGPTVSVAQLAANGANCAAGQAPLGVDAAGEVEGCYDVTTQSEMDTHTGNTTTAHGAVSTNTPSKVVVRDANGDFAAGTITANLTGNCSGSSGSTTGNAATATKSTNLTGGNGTTLLGSMPYQSNTDTTTLLSPNTTTTKKFFRQTGDGSNGAAPAWDTIATGDLPTIKGSDFLPIGNAIDGAAAPAILAALTSTNKINTRAFDGASNEDVQFTWQVPFDFTGSTITFNVVGYISNATAPAENEIVDFSLACVSQGNSEILSTAVGTAQTSSLTADATYLQYDRLATTYSSAITPAGSIAAGETVVCSLTRLAELGAEINANTAFADSSSWTLGSGWSVADGVLSYSGSGGGWATSANGITTGKRYEVTYTITAITQGTVAATIGDVFLTGRTAPGTYTEQFTAAADYGLSFVSTAGPFIGSIDNASVKEVFDTYAQDFDVAGINIKYSRALTN